MSSVCAKDSKIQNIPTQVMAVVGEVYWNISLAVWTWDFETKPRY